LKELLVRGHLGLGDALIVNAIIRHLCKTQAVTFLHKAHNAQAIAFMFRDLDNLSLISTRNAEGALPMGCKDDDEVADLMCKEMRKAGKQVLGLGLYGEKRLWNHAPGFDESFYKQVGLDHHDRWNGFKCARQESRELEVPSGKYCFVHEDAERGFIIPPEALPQRKMKIVRPDKTLKNKHGDPCMIFDYWGWLDGAEEIHCIDSSFAIMVDHLHLPKFQNKRLVLHLGLRPNEYPPARAKDWEIIRHNQFKTS
jgi:hypothetical protein